MMLLLHNYFDAILLYFGQNLFRCQNIIFREHFGLSNRTPTPIIHVLPLARRIRHESPTHTLSSEILEAVFSN